MQYFKVTISEVQKKNLLLCLDRELKSSGLDNLSAVVDLFNMLQSAQSIDTEEIQENAPQEDEKGTQEEL